MTTKISVKRPLSSLQRKSPDSEKVALSDSLVGEMLNGVEGTLTGKVKKTGLYYLSFLIPCKRLIIWMVVLLSQNIWIVIAGVLDIVVTVLWCALSFKMRKINKKIRSFKLLTKLDNG